MHKEIRNSDIKKLVGDRLKDETVFFFTFLLSSNMFEYIFNDNEQKNTFDPLKTMNLGYQN